MERYISKSAIIAEIEKETKTLRQEIPSCENKEHKKGKLFGLQRALYLIDSLEVKEVDLDYIKKELDELIRFNKPDGDFGWGTLYNVATHFFELGLKAQKGK